LIGAAGFSQPAAVVVAVPAAGGFESDLRL